MLFLFVILYNYIISYSANCLHSFLSVAMSRTSKQRQDDKHEKLLREETRKHGNNECFDCTQKVS